MIQNLITLNNIGTTIAIIGAGAAGYFAALRHKELYPQHHVVIFEKTSKVLGKVKISGGGRCNVTHAIYIPRELVKYYPRGEKELLGSFSKFQPADTIHWFEKRGVELKVEDDGRMFPITDKSQSIIDCLETNRQNLGVQLTLNQQLESVNLHENKFKLFFSNQEQIIADQLIVTSGSNESMWNLIKSLGHTIADPIPSLFTFNIVDKRLDGFAGVSWQNVEIKLSNSKFSNTGPLLITHWGLSGPAVLKMSAFAAKELYQRNYITEIEINFLYPNSFNETIEKFLEIKESNPNKLLSSQIPFGFTQRIWSAWLSLWSFENKKWQEISVKSLNIISENLTRAKFKIDGKSTFKEEFVTCGGVSLKELDMKTMESKIVPNLFFAGEVLDVDAVTGGFNFQAAWTTGWIAGSNDVLNKSL